MNTEAPEFLEYLRTRCIEMALVGSRVTCSPAPVDTDQDVLVLFDAASEPHLGGELLDLGFDIDGSQVCDPVQYLTATDTFQSFSKGDLNIIVTQDREFYRKFLAATHVAQRLNLLDKGDRIALFQAVLYANPDCFVREREPDEMDELI